MLYNKTKQEKEWKKKGKDKKTCFLCVIEWLVLFSGQVLSGNVECMGFLVWWADKWEEGMVMDSLTHPSHTSHLEKKMLWRYLVDHNIYWQPDVFCFPCE